MCLIIFVCIFTTDEVWKINFPLKSLNVSLAVRAIANPSLVNILRPLFLIREQSYNEQSEMALLKLEV